MKRLYGRRREHVSLAEIFLGQWSAFLSGAVGFVYSPKFCRFIELTQEGKALGADGQHFDLTEVFEARCFNSRGELRWLNEKKGLGQAVLISELQLEESFGINADLEYEDSLSNQYLLWGEYSKDSSQPGWSKVSTARIGTLNVPIPKIASQERVYLIACEYLQVVDAYGNMAVVEERLTGLEAK